jgi:tetratricopeptide (TPR) repeat protein
MMLKNKKNKTAFYAYFDTLMMVYDARIEHFGEKGKVRGRQGVAVLKYNKSKYDMAYQYLSESVKLSGTKTSAATASTFMQTSAAMFKASKHDAGQTVEDLGMAMDALDPAVEKARLNAAKAQGTKTHAKLVKKHTNLKKAMKNVEILFVESGAAGCNELIGYFTPKFDENPNDLKMLKKITKYLDDQGCDDSELFAKAAEQRFKLEPSASAAYSLAKMFMKKEQLDKSIEYYNKAIEQEATSEVPNEEFQAKCEYQKAVALYVQKQFGKSRAAAIQAAKHRSDWGEPYILIARLYAGSSARCTNKIDASAVYWVAVDKLQKAKSVDPEVADKAQKLINQYSKHYPNKEEAFFHGISKGVPYKVGCWINETTKARF